MNFGTMGLKSSWLKSLGLKGLELKLGVENSGVEMSFNRFDYILLSWMSLNKNLSLIDN